MARFLGGGGGGGGGGGVGFACVEEASSRGHAIRRRGAGRRPRRGTFDTGERTSMFKILAVIAAVLAALFAVGYFLILGVGKPIGTDLSVVGRGKPALVLAHENFSPTGGDALNRLREIRSDYDARLEFVVADLGTPRGRAFAERHGLFDGRAVFLTRDGEPLRVTDVPADERELRDRLEAGLAAME